MNLTWLDDVLILLEEGNMTRAANRRNITQPAFSRRIRSFEDWLGTQVLDRRVNRIDLSPALIANEAEIRALTARIHELRGKILHHNPANTTVTIAAQHAPILSTFPDMSLRARQDFPLLKFRLRAGNLPECVSIFLRGDASMLLCYEAENAPPLPFGDAVQRDIWGADRLVPLVGGSLRYIAENDGSVPEDSPAIVYPEQSHFGEVLAKAKKPFATRSFTTNPICETAFSNGIKELVLKGLGIAWLPVSMTYKEIEAGQMINLSNRYGSVALTIALYADAQDGIANALLKIWGTDKG